MTGRSPIRFSLRTGKYSNVCFLCFCLLTFQFFFSFLFFSFLFSLIFLFFFLILQQVYKCRQSNINYYQSLVIHSFASPYFFYMCICMCMYRLFVRIAGVITTTTITITNETTLLSKLAICIFFISHPTSLQRATNTLNSSYPSYGNDK